MLEIVLSHYGTHVLIYFPVLEILLREYYLLPDQVPL